MRLIFEQRVLAVSEDVVCERLLADESRTAGRSFPQPDLNIAATAPQHGLMADSRATSGYERARIPVINPQSKAAS